MLKKRILLIVVAIFLAMSPALAGCSTSSKQVVKDGVIMSGVRFKTSEQTDSKNKEYKNLTANFSLENTTDETVEVKVTLAFIADIWGQVRIKEEKVFILEAKVKVSKSITKTNIYSLIREKNVFLDSVIKV